MFNMGIATNFTSEVSKDVAGKNYHLQLSQEIEKFVDSVIDKFGGVIGLVDLYCMYNRARGTDLISPEDLNIACSLIQKQSSRYMHRVYPSGVHTIQSRQFNEDAYFQKITATLAQSNGVSAIKLAEQMKVNVVLMKEHIQVAEDKGFVCRDESYEGVLWYPNKIN